MVTTAACQVRPAWMVPHLHNNTDISMLDKLLKWRSGRGYRMHSDEQRLRSRRNDNLSAAVNVVTTEGRSRRCGITATAVCSVTDTPPSVMVASTPTAP